MTKVEWVLEDEDFMVFSTEASDQYDMASDKARTPRTSKMTWKIVNKRIKRKIENPSSVKGICACDSDFLCEHRKKYLKEALRG